MTTTKDKLIQIRIDSELLKRFEIYAQAQGLAISAAIRSNMKHTCDQYELYTARREAEQQRLLNKI